MKQLSGLDASFLYMETPEMPMHVGALHVFELPAGYKGDFVADMRRHMAARLPLAPALRRKLAWMPFNLANPVWVDAVPDLDEHIEAVKLRKGATMTDLETQVGKLHPLLIERDKPLWKFYVFEGMAPGPNKEKRYGMYTKLHHAAVDGQAAVALAAAILDVSPEPRDIQHEQRPPKNLHIGMAEMLSGVFANQLQQYANVVKNLPSTVGALSQVARQGASGVTGAAVAKVRGKSKPAEESVSLGLAPRTRLNASVTPLRAFASASLPMAELKALRRAHDATLNDVVLMVCSGALRRYFLDHGPLPRKSLVAAVPVSTRTAGDTSSNNQASMTVVNLGTHVADPMKRLLYVKAATAAMKASLGSVKTLMPIDFPSLGVPWLMSAVSAVYGRAKVADRIPPIANVAISNVPGPAFPLFMAGGRMLVNYPTSIVVHGVALNITVQSYNESLDFGMMACGKAMPQVAELATHIHEAFAELKALPPTVAPASDATQAKTPGTPVARKKRAARPSPVADATRATRASAPSRPASHR
ncbi:wax ester/triacylglycerol synthase family O-acyltransferase [Piscinibacter sp. XHJ-5]|uniref:wax ester/triacylglycerol synthase family O-acyltransferase n=1 Tax=Piscinibacter sp. XHJ-5 TaxID=3037797 RepID=UPI0024532DCC|nr:wax ester/triacylglycerol synthase family O-acyltransferase [Piscinibacter sp. XHJ-5]